jgi:hypothetical protein
MSSLTSGSSVLRTSGVRRFLAVLAVDSVCFVALVWGAFYDAMSGLGWESGTPASPVHYFSWAVVLVGGTLAVHAFYAYWRNWIPEAGIQGILAIVAVLAGLGMLSSTHDAAAQPNPVHTTQTPNGDFCYSGGQCFINGVPVSGHP